MLKVDMKSKSVYMNCRSTMISASSHCLHAHSISTITAFLQTATVTGRDVELTSLISALKTQFQCWSFSKFFDQNLFVMTHRMEKLTFVQRKNRIWISFSASLRAACICVLPWSPLQTQPVDEAFYERGLWFERPPQAYLYWNECPIQEKKKAPPLFRGPRWEQLQLAEFLPHREQVRDPSPHLHHHHQNPSDHLMSYFIQQKQHFWCSSIILALSAWPSLLFNMELLNRISSLPSLKSGSSFKVVLWFCADCFRSVWFSAVVAPRCRSQ